MSAPSLLILVSTSPSLLHTSLQAAWQQGQQGSGKDASRHVCCTFAQVHSGAAAPTAAPQPQLTLQHRHYTHTHTHTHICISQHQSAADKATVHGWTHSSPERWHPLLLSIHMQGAVLQLVAVCGTAARAAGDIINLKPLCLLMVAGAAPAVAQANSHTIAHRAEQRHAACIDCRVPVSQKAGEKQKQVRRQPGGRMRAPLAASTRRAEALPSYRSVSFTPSSSSTSVVV
jgi:hypothetical protein